MRMEDLLGKTDGVCRRFWNHSNQVLKMKVLGTSEDGISGVFLL